MCGAQRNTRPNQRFVMPLHGWRNLNVRLQKKQTRERGRSCPARGMAERPGALRMSDENLIRLLRGQAWERAKGELNSMLRTYHSSHSSTSEGQFEAASRLFDKFISYVSHSNSYRNCHTSFSSRTISSTNKTIYSIFNICIGHYN